MPAHLPPSEDQLDFSDLEAKYRVTKDESYDRVLIVDNTPQVDANRAEKLKTVLLKIFQAYGTVVQFHAFHDKDPKNPAATISKPYVFIEYETAEQASNAAKALDGNPLDKNHTLAVYKMTDISKLSTVSDTFVPPQIEPFEEKEHLRSWLADPRARDEFVILNANQTTIFWNEKGENPEHVYSRENWTETYVQWSPRGTYLATLHRQGVALWGGASWKKIVRFMHPGVKLIDFSPNERYLVTWSADRVDKENANVFVWDIQTGAKLRSFHEESKQVVWPILKWSPDSKFLAKHIENGISVYETPSMGLLKKKSIKIEGIKDFAWSPADPLLAYWTPEAGDTPARVTLIEVPSLETKAAKNLFSVSDCKIHWQNEGDYLCVKVDRYTKTKKSTIANFEVFRIREKNIPVDVLEIKDTIVAFAWEPFNKRFAFIHTDGPKIMVSFYELDSSKGSSGFKLLKSLERKAVSHLFWSPKGQFILLAGLRFNGELEFINVNDMETMAKQEHYMATDVEWDPSGRFVTTSVSFWTQKMENGYIMWDFKGKVIRRQLLDKFMQLVWRPRPPSPLSKDKQKEIRKNIKEYSKVFDEQDAKDNMFASDEVSQARRRKFDEWNAWRKDCLAYYSKIRPAIIDLLGYDSEKDKDLTVVEETVEELISETSEVIQV